MVRLLLAVAAVVALSVPIGASGSPIQPTLSAKVTARSISLTDSSGKPVRSLAQRSYRIVVKDSAKGQNFHLIGPAVNAKTRVAARGARTWILNLRPGKYVYKSDKNTKLRGTFTVESNPPPA
jgi:hypothetical protein